jgi:hypothetical protein
VRGEAKRPTVYHGGIDGKLHVEAADFWAECMERVEQVKNVDGTDTHIQTGVNRKQYVNDPSLGVFKTKESVEFEKWLKARTPGTITIQAVYASGCVFGIRYGASWSFYLQKSAQVITSRVVKASEVNTNVPENQKPQLKGYSPAMEATVITPKKEPGWLGFKKTVYHAEITHDRPIVIQEFYPTSNGVVKIADEVRLVK